MTEEEVKELWELCGFKIWSSGWYRYPNKAFRSKLPLITLYNLFQWAVPLLERWEMGSAKDGTTYAFVACKGLFFPFVEADYDSPAEALAQACLQALRGAK